MMVGIMTLYLPDIVIVMRLCPAEFGSPCDLSGIISSVFIQSRERVSSRIRGNGYAAIHHRV